MRLSLLLLTVTLVFYSCNNQKNKTRNREDIIMDQWGDWKILEWKNPDIFPASGIDFAQLLFHKDKQAERILHRGGNKENFDFTWRLSEDTLFLSNKKYLINELTDTIFIFSALTEGDAEYVKLERKKITATVSTGKEKQDQQELQPEKVPAEVQSAESFMRQTISQESSDALKLASFTKLNGREISNFAGSFYEVEYKMNVEVMKPYFMNTPFGTYFSHDGSGHFFVCYPQKNNIWGDIRSILTSGDVYQITGTVTLSKWENGYKGESYELKGYQRISSGHSSQSISEATTNTKRSVTSDRAYFYSAANGERLNSYLIRGDMVTVKTTNDDWFYGTFTNAKGTTTEGWLRERDFSSSKGDNKTSLISTMPSKKVDMQYIWENGCDLQVIGSKKVKIYFSASAEDQTIFTFDPGEQIVSDCTNKATNGFVYRFSIKNKQGWVLSSDLK